MRGIEEDAGVPGVFGVDVGVCLMGLCADDVRIASPWEKRIDRAVEEKAENLL